MSLTSLIPVIVLAVGLALGGDAKASDRPLLAPGESRSTRVEGCETLAEEGLRFRSSSWRDLHQLLYAQAAAQRPAARGRVESAPEEMPSDLSPADAEDWRQALSFYSTFDGRDLLFDAELVRIGRALSQAGPDLSRSGLPVDLRQALILARPVYDRHFRDRHRAMNDAWCRALEPLLAAHSGAALARLRRLYMTSGPAVLPVEVTRYANWAGAYTALDPVEITIATAHPANQGTAALEIVLHEASHAMAEPLMRSLDNARNRHAEGTEAAALPRDLWHQVLFYLTGEVVSDLLPGHVPYADQNGLWVRVWTGPARGLLAKHLDPLLREEISLEAAIEELVADWIRSTSPAPQSGSLPD